MRPYLALIKDSFRAAMASRVLYILLFLIVGLLLLLAPLRMHETLDWKLIFNENVKKPNEVAELLVKKHENEKSVGRIWELLPADLKKNLISFDSSDQSDSSNDDQKDSDAESVEETESDRPRRRRGGRPNDEAMVYQLSLFSGLNEVIENPEFYRAEDWEGVSLSGEARELIESGPDKLSEERVRRLNRLLVARALSPSIETGGTALEFWYAFWKIDFLTTSMTHQQFAQMLTTQLPYYFEKFVLSIGMFIAILVTANMIPDTFEPGSLNLLLSKPVARWATYVAKFFGGCTFILLCSSLLFLGIWLWLGLGFEVWDRAMLLSIPLYVLVFAIYFSVSALVGLIWRSPILSVIVTLLFWVTCFSVGALHGFFATKLENNGFVDLMPAGEQAYPVDQLQQFRVWNAGSNQWEIKVEAEMGPDVGMQYAVNSWIFPLRNLPNPNTPKITERLSPKFSPDQGLIFSSPYVADFRSPRKLAVADVEDLNFEFVGNLPRDTQKLAMTKNGLVAVAGNGGFHLLSNEVSETIKASLNSKDDDAEESSETKSDQEEDSNESEPDKQKAGTANSFASLGKLFEKIGPNRTVSVRNSNLVDFNPVTQQFAIYRSSRGGKLTLFDVQDDGQFKRGQTLTPELDFDRKKMSGLIAFKGSTILLAFGNGIIAEYDAASLELRKQHHPEKRSAIQTVAGSPDGNLFGIQYRNGDLWVLNKSKSEEFEFASVTGQGKVNAFAFGEGDKLWVTDNTDRVTMYDQSAGTSGDRLTPSGTWYENAYRYAIAPLYKIFPKPGEFYKVVSHLSSSGDTATNMDVDLRINPLENANPWQPLWNGLAFMFGMLMLASTYFHFKDF